MIDFYQVLALAIIQGLTEFLPISSSAHLILPAELLHWPDQGLAFDVAVHLGSLLAIVLYFRGQLISLSQGFFSQVAGKGRSQESDLAWCIILATVPAVIVGLLLNPYMHHLRHSLVIAATTILFGLLLGFADFVANKQREPLSKVALPQALFIGLMQCLALIPGTSRSGITMTAALMLGFNREVAARFSFLLSIPLIFAASSLKLYELVQSELVVDWLMLSAGIVFSFVSAYLCIHLFLKWIERLGFMPFVIYRLLLGALLLFLYFN